MEGLIDGAFAEFLEANRSALNARFAEARRMHADLDPQAFTGILHQLVAPVVSAVEQFDPGSAHPAALLLYDLALDLAGKGFLGANSRYPQISLGWKVLLPELPGLISTEPRRVIGSVTNALYNLSLAPGARPQEWIDIMRALAPLTSDASQFLRAGQAAAWRAGLAHYRRDALRIYRDLPPAMARTALCLPAEEQTGSTVQLLERLEADPWLNPGSPGDPAGKAHRLQIVRRVGAFRGFGGPFLQPPRVFGAEQGFLVQDGENRWLLVADFFGATFHRADGMQPTSGTGPFSIDERGIIKLGKLEARLDELSGYSAAACVGRTLAVTSPMSFAISLVAAVES